MIAARVTDFGPVLHEEELAAGKVLALPGRGEARDFLDIFGLSQRLSWPRLLDLAQRNGQTRKPGVRPRYSAFSAPLRLHACSSAGTTQYKACPLSQQQPCVLRCSGGSRSGRRVKTTRQTDAPSAH